VLNELWKKKFSVNWGFEGSTFDSTIHEIKGRIGGKGKVEKVMKALIRGGAKVGSDDKGRVMRKAEVTVMEG